MRSTVEAGAKSGSGGAGGAQPKVTVIVPIHDKATDLGACLDSIAAQTLDEIEVVCVDDASSDDSFEIAAARARSDRRFIVLRNERNLGPGPTRNRGLRRATAPFVQFTDADDILPPSALELLLALATKDDVPLVRGTLGNLERGHHQPWFDECQVMTERHRIDLNEERKLWIPYFHVCYLFSRGFLARENLEYPNLRCGEDPVFLANCLVRAPRLSTLPATTYLYRRDLHPERARYENLLDFLAHVAELKRIFLESRHAKCWAEAGELFYLRDVLLLARRCALDSIQRAHVLALARRIWPSVSLELEA